MPEVLVILAPNTIIEPVAVMVESLGALVTQTTVFRLLIHKHIA